MIIDSPIISGSTSATGSLNQVGNVTITGSLTVTGAIIGAVTGSVDSASFAANAALLNNKNSGEFVPTGSFNTFSSSILSYTGSNNTNIGNLNATSASLNTFTGSAASRLSSIESTTGSLNTASGSAITRLNALEVTSGSNITRISALESASGSAITRLSALESASGSAITRLSSIESTTGSLNTASGSAITRLNALESASGSAITRLNAIEVVTGSNISRLSSLESKTGSYATTGSNTFVSTQYISASNNPTGFTTTASLYTDGGLRVTRDAYISGTLYLNNVTVYGTQSIAYISSSQLNIASNLITVNTATPSVQFGGLAVYDSGSSGLTGSILWDSTNNRWIYSNPSGSTYDGGMLISGPRNSSGLGNEVGTTACALMMGQGGDHITSSAIFHYGNATCFYGNTVITGSGAVCSTMGNFTCIGVGSPAPAYPLDICGTARSTSNFVVNNGTVVGNYTINGSQVQIGTSLNHPFAITTNNTERVSIANSGVACFACQVCTPILFASTAIFSNVYCVNSYNSLSSTTSGQMGVLGHNAISSQSVANTIIQMNNGYYGSFIRQYYNEGITFYTRANAGLAGDVLYGTGAVADGGQRLRIDSTGIACFACQVCAPSFLSSGTICSSGNACFGGVTVIAGCVGIGTSNPLHKLEVGGNISINGGSFLDFANGDVRFVNSSGNLSIQTYSISTGLSTKASITGTGITCFANTVCAPQAVFNCLGVGQAWSTTGGTSQTLQVKGIGSCDAAWFEGAGGNDAGIYIGISGCDGRIGTSYRSAMTYGGLLFQTTGQTRFSIAANGISTFACTVCAPNYYLTSNTGLILFGSDSAVNSYLQSDSSNNLYLGTSNGYRILIPADGGCMVFRTSCSAANPQTRLTISCTGIATFACQVCAPAFYSSTSSSTLNGLLVTCTISSRCFTGITVENFAGAGSECARAGIVFKGYDWVQGGIWHGRNGGAFDGALVFGTNPDTTNLTAGGLCTRLVFNNAGIATFSCQVCAPTLVSSGVINWNGTVGALSYSTGLVTMETNSATCIQLKTNGTAALTIDTFQRVGIGTVPSAKLQVVGDLRWSSGGNSYYTYSDMDGGGLYIETVDNNTSRAKMRFQTRVNNAGSYTSYQIDADNNQHVWVINGSTRMTLNSSFALVPGSNGTQDLGSSSLRWCTVYTSDLSLNNGIGNYTIVEGENDLFLYNNNSCKVFKFLLQEVCPEIAPAKRSI